MTHVPRPHSVGVNAKLSLLKLLSASESSVMHVECLCWWKAIEHVHVNLILRDSDILV